MRGPAGFAKLVNLFMNIIMGLCISLVIFIAAGIPIIPEVLISAWFASFFIGYTAGDLGPVNSWSMGLAHVLHINNSFGRYLIAAIIFGLYFGLIILFGNALINNLASAGWGAVFGFFVSFVGLVLGAAIILVFIFMKPCQMLAATISGFNPAKMSASENSESVSIHS